MSRSKSFLSGAFYAYLYQGCAMLLGLWLTPFYLRTLGDHDYGIWLVALQVLTFLLLADLGVIAVVPRDIAREHGREISEQQSDRLQILMGQTTKVILYQTLLVATAALGLFFFRVRSSPALQGPVGLVLLVFVLTYPLRVFPAVLTGLQDLKFLGQTRMWLWSVSTGVTILLLLSGARFYALAIGWCLQEIGSNVVGLWRLHRVRADLVSWIPWQKAGTMQLSWFARGFWVSLSQIALWLLSGADLLIIARVLGPGVVVVYSCTSKLINVLQNQPQILAGIALPGLSQMRASESRERTMRATICLTQGMLLVAGGVFSVVFALNQHFVNLWVGARFFGGPAVTALVVVNFLFRLIDYTLALALFAFGYEKFFGVRFLLDGLVSVGIATLLVGKMGLQGVAIGFLCGVVLVAIPIDAYLLARELKISLRQIVEPYIPYVWRSAVVGVGAFAIMQRVEIPNLFALVAAATLIGCVYLLAVFQHVWRSPLGDYIKPLLSNVQSSMRNRVLSWSNNS